MDSAFRIKSGIFYVLCQAAGQGHVYLPLDELESYVKSLLLIEFDNMESYIMDLAVDKKVVVKQSGDRKLVYAAIYYYMETSVARKLCDLDISYSCNDEEMEESIEKIEQRLNIELDEIQKEAVKKTVQNGLVVITGGPGTGKTTTINTIIRYFQMEGLDIRLAAPTGRAAKRMSETCGMEAQTIHRLLEISGGPQEDSNGSSFATNFDRNEENPLETDAIIVVVRLEKIFRQAAESEIVINAHKINKGELVVLNKYSKDFLFVRRETPDEIIAAICTLVKKKLPDYVGAGINEIQILTPSKKSATGSLRLNKIMQEYLNPPQAGKQEKVYGEVTFREGDKVMQIKNNYQTEWEKKSKYGVTYDAGSGVFNGDTGIITEINTFMEQMTVKFDDERIVKYDFKQLEELELAYAITVHKSQGSEYPAVVIPMYPGPRMLMNKNLLYTAVTRARKCVCMVGNENCFHQMAQNESEQRRYSSLDERIKEIYELDNAV